MTPTEFDVAAELFAAWWVTVGTELNTWAGQANDLAGDANTLAAALASANFKGNWADLTGALDMPACVLHENQYWMLLDDLLDVTASEPDATNADWALLDGWTVVLEKAADHTITAAEAKTGQTIFTNYGAAGAIVYTLPARTGDFHLRFCVEAAQYLRVNPPAGETIAGLNADATAADGYIRSNVAGTYWEIYGNVNIGYRLTYLRGTLLVDA
jgi:hypothetical protein